MQQVRLLGEREMMREVLARLRSRGVVDDGMEQRVLSSSEPVSLLVQGGVSDTVLGQAVADVCGARFVGEEELHGLLDREVHRRMVEVLSGLPAVAFRAGEDGSVDVAVATMLDGDFLEEVERRLTQAGVSGVREWVVAPMGVIEELAGRYGRSSGGVGREALREMLARAVEEEDVEGEQGAQGWRSTHAGRAVLALVEEALRVGATDIHIRPHSANESQIAFRVDGDLRVQEVIGEGVHRRLGTVIKNAAEIDITRATEAGDGSIKERIANRSVTLRVSTIPTYYQRDRICIRILQSSAMGRQRRLADLGYLPEEIEAVRKALSFTAGMVLVTGPTGSGKNTTMYAMLGESYQRTRAYLTLEDPIEMILPFADQTEVTLRSSGEGHGISFASGLRAFLRQDPDVIMLGEIRDEETAEVAAHAAMTGHLLFTTLHTNSAPDSVLRLEELGISRLTIAQIVNILVAQRLAKRLCPSCRREVKPSMEYLLERVPAMTEGMARAYGMVDAEVWYDYGDGCEECEGRGYRGRMAVPEAVYVDDEYKAMILDGDMGGFRRRMVERREDMLSAVVKRVLSGDLGISAIPYVVPRF